MKSLTPKQKAILQFMADHAQAHGYAPTHREIQAHFNLGSTNGVRQQLERLMSKGYLAKAHGVARGLRLLPAAGTAEATHDARLRFSAIPTISGHAKGLADGLELHLTQGYDINLRGLLDGLRQIETLATLPEAP